MKITPFIEHLRDILDSIGYKLYFGKRSDYNTLKAPSDKTVILEPFLMRVSRANQCEYNTSFSLWVGLRRPIDCEFRNDLGINLEFIDESLEEARKVINTLGNSEKILITQNIDTIPIRYDEADGMLTNNSEAFTSFQLPVKIWL